MTQDPMTILFGQQQQPQQPPQQPVQPQYVPPQPQPQYVPPQQPVQPQPAPQPVQPEPTPPPPPQYQPGQFDDSATVPKRVAALEKRQALKLAKQTGLFAIGGSLIITAAAVYSATAGTGAGIILAIFMAWFVYRATAEIKRLEAAYQIHPKTK